jgi:hypothetical protein
LAKKARAHRIGTTNGTFFDPNGTPVWSESKLTPKHIALLVQYRSMNAQGVLPKIKHCIHCQTMNIPHDTVQHYLSHCEKGEEIALCPSRKATLTSRETAAWPLLNGTVLSDLCAHPHGRENMLSLALDTLNHCLLFEQNS